MVAFGSFRLAEARARNNANILKFVTYVKRTKMKNCDADGCSPAMKYRMRSKKKMETNLNGVSTMLRARISAEGRIMANCRCRTMTGRAAYEVVISARPVNEL